MNQIPSRAACTYELSKAFPGAHYVERSIDGARWLELRYNIPGHKEPAPICAVPLTATNKALAPLALLSKAVQQYGFKLRSAHLVKSGVDSVWQFVYDPIAEPNPTPEGTPDDRH